MRHCGRDLLRSSSVLARGLRSGRRGSIWGRASSAVSTTSRTYWRGSRGNDTSDPSTFPADFDHHRTAGGRTEVGIDHAYALTSYAVQGSTHDVSTSRIDPTATRAETYVDITRGRHANHLYLTPATDPLDGEALPRVPAASADQAVAHRLDTPPANSPPGNSAPMTGHR